MTEIRIPPTYEEATIKVLFFILTRIEGEYKRIDMNTEVLEDD